MNALSFSHSHFDYGLPAEVGKFDYCSSLSSAPQLGAVNAALFPLHPPREESRSGLNAWNALGHFDLLLPHCPALSPRLAGFGFPLKDYPPLPGLPPSPGLRWTGQRTRRADRLRQTRQDLAPPVEAPVMDFQIRRFTPLFGPSAPRPFPLRGRPAAPLGARGSRKKQVPDSRPNARW
jgi:hypothetical protein